jgi:hypothetical protein
MPAYRRKKMLTQSAFATSLFRKATPVLVALSLFMVAAQAQTKLGPPERIVNGQTAPVGLIQGETLRYTAFNPSETDSGEPNEPISLRMKLYDKDGAVIAVSPKVVIPPGEFRWIDFNRDELGLSGEPGTTRAQVRMQPLWGLRANNRLHVSTSLEIINNTSGGTYRFFITVEALP